MGQPANRPAQDVQLSIKPSVRNVLFTSTMQQFPFFCAQLAKFWEANGERHGDGKHKSETQGNHELRPFLHDFNMRQQSTLNDLLRAAQRCATVGRTDSPCRFGGQRLSLLQGAPYLTAGSRPICESAVPQFQVLVSSDLLPPAYDANTLRRGTSASRPPATPMADRKHSRQNNRPETFSPDACRWPPGSWQSIFRPAHIRARCCLCQAHTPRRARTARASAATCG